MSDTIHEGDRREQIEKTGGRISIYTGEITGTRNGSDYTFDGGKAVKNK